MIMLGNTDVAPTLDSLDQRKKDKEKVSMSKYKRMGLRSNTKSTVRAKPLVLISGLGYPRWQWHKMVPSPGRAFQGNHL